MLLGLGPDGPITGRRVAITGIGVVSSVGSGARRLLDRSARAGAGR